MKKFWTLLVALVVLALAVPADARGHFRRNHGGTGYHEFDRALNNTRRLVISPLRDLQYQYADGARRWDAENYRLYGSRPRGIYWGRSNHNPLGVEEPSRCFERVVKNARKQHVELTAEQALAFCGGEPVAATALEPVEQPVQEQEPEEFVVLPESTPAPTPAPTVAPTPAPTPTPKPAKPKAAAAPAPRVVRHTLTPGCWAVIGGLLILGFVGLLLFLAGVVFHDAYTSRRSQ